MLLVSDDRRDMDGHSVSDTKGILSQKLSAQGRSSTWKDQALRDWAWVWK